MNLSDYQTLSGTSLTHLAPVVTPAASDQLLISRKQLDIDYPKWWFSRRISYDTFAENIFQDLSAKFKFGSMAYELSTDYAKSNHTHSQYNKVSAYIDYTDSTNQNYLELAVIKLDGKKISMMMPKPTYPDHIMTGNEHVGGELKFDFRPVMKTINVNAADFDGWVYADGKEYPNNFEFASSFDQGSDSNHFVVPNYHEMLFMETSLTASSGDKVFPEVHGFKSHSHTVKLELDGEISGTFKFDYGSADGNGSGIHGSKTDPTKGKDIDIQVETSLSGLNFQLAGKIENCASNNKHTHPTFTYIPMLVYIGKKIK